jgi:Domain of unknown function (DUF4386)
MTRAANARVAGFTFLFYIAAGITGVILFGRASGGEGVAANLASIAQHASGVGITVVLDLLQCFSALVLAVTLYAITRDEDPDLAMLALACRVSEGVLAALGVSSTLGLVWLATAAGANAPDPAAAHALAAFLLRGNVALTATFFAAGSALFSYLLLRGRMIPIPLAWLGVVASALLVVELPLQLAGFVHGTVTALVWIPMLAFEVPLALWLLVKGVAAPARMRTA